MKARLPAVLLLFFFSALPAYAAIYKWVDENGVTHYSQTPPTSDTQSQKLTVPRGPAPPPPAKSQNAQPEKPNEGDAQKTEATNDANEKLKKQREKACETAKNNLQELDNHGRVRETDAEGNTRFLSDDEKMTRRQEMLDLIKKYCK